MRTIDFNGYIDDDEIWGDEVTPEHLHEMLYGEDGSCNDDVTLRLNSYGGSCVAATRMYDMIRDYPGLVHVVVSGVSASAATVVMSAGSTLQVTPGSLVMIHNPKMCACGEVRDFQQAIRLLETTKNSIIAIYRKRSKVGADELARMMDETTWMTAEEAVQNGLADAVLEDGAKYPTNAAERTPRLSIEEAQKKVAAFYTRGEAPKAKSEKEPAREPVSGVRKDELLRRLALLEKE